MEKTARGKPLSGLDTAEESEEYLAAPERDAMVVRDEHYQTVAFLAKSLSDENRLRIILCVSNPGYRRQGKAGPAPGGFPPGGSIPGAHGGAQKSVNR